MIQRSDVSDYFKYMDERETESIWKVYGEYTESIWRVYGEYAESNTDGEYTERVWRVYGE